MGNHGAVSAKGGAGLADNGVKRPTEVGAPGSRLLLLSNWPVSQRLFAVIALALVMGLVFGGLRVAGAEGSAAQFGHVSRLANLGVQDTVLIQALQDERDAIAGPLTAGRTGAFDSLYTATDAAATGVRQAAAAIGGGLPANIAADVGTVLADISPGQIAALRRTLGSGEDTSAEIANFGVPISDIITLNDQIGQGVSDSALANDVRALNFLSMAKEEASQERAVLYSLLSDPYFVQGDPSPTDSGMLFALNIAYAQERIAETEFGTAATPAEQTLFNAALGSPGAREAQDIQDFIYGNAPNVPATAPLNPNPLSVITALGFGLKQAPHEWYSAMSAKVGEMRSVEQTIAANIASRAQALQGGAQQTALISGVITAALLLLVLVGALLVARSLVLPLRRLRAGALDIASTQLPERVKQLSEATGAEVNLDVAPIDVLTGDEIGQVARAFDQVHAEAVRLAGNEALLRTSFNAVFVNLSRRSQSLIERLARQIESLEQDEDDPSRLSGLFSMDHLVTRMRRNSENLLLLAGHEGARKWTEPVALADVTRAATAEIEQYGRVVLNAQPGVAVIGQAVSDVVHLLAELIENATLFSPKDTQIQVTAQELNSGGVLIEICDKGIGISETRLSEMNFRLDNPPVIDVSVSRHMGLFAVARLAERHRIRIRLRPAPPQGLSALVWLPDALIERIPRGYISPSGRWSKPFGAQAGLLARRSPSQQIIGQRPALEDRQPADAAEGPLAVRAVGFAAGKDDAISNWFRSRRITATGVGSGSAVRSAAGADDSGAGGWQSAPLPQQGWSGPHGIDTLAQGRRAAEIINDPIRGDVTAAGLPLRVPKANLLPGSAGRAAPGTPRTPGGLRSEDNYQEVPAAPLPYRSPELARDRLSGFQRGARRAEGRRSLAGEGDDR
jgi:signal transduction histidine kinase